MPAEAARLHHPLGARDRRLIVLLACVAVLAIPLGFLVVRPHGGDGAAPGCIRADVAGIMGGGTIAGCGSDASALCKVYAAAYASVAAQCAALPQKPGNAS
jgi:hypothetical protein